MHHDFEIHQGAMLRANVLDVSMHGGVCWTMSYDWIKRGLCGLVRTENTYTNIARFVSAQRSLEQAWSFVNFRNMIATSDGLLVAAIKDARFEDDAGWDVLARSISTCGHGFYELYLEGGNAQHGLWGHATAFSNEAEGRRFFNPSGGQWSQVGSGGPGDYIVRGLPNEHAPALRHHYADTAHWTIWQYRGVPRDGVWLQSNP